MMLIRPGEEPTDRMLDAVCSLLVDAAEIFEKGPGAEWPMSAVFDLAKSRILHYKATQLFGWEQAPLWAQECHYIACKHAHPSDEHAMQWNKAWKERGKPPQEAAEHLRFAATCWDETVASVIENSRDNPKVWEPRVNELLAAGVDPLLELCKAINDAGIEGIQSTISGGKYEPDPNALKH